MNSKRELARIKRHNRIRMRVIGTAARPRLVIRRSLKHLHAQVVDDTQNKVLFSASTFDKQIKGACATAGNVKAAVMLGEIFAKKAHEKGISSIVFDRAGYLYHGRVKAFADSLRKGGLHF